MTGLSGNMRKVVQAPRPVGAPINLREMAIMARLHCHIGAVRRVERLTTPWRGAHGKPITVLDVGGVAVRMDGAPSVGEGDLVTVVGRHRTGGLWAAALRNESTDVRYAPEARYLALFGALLLGVVVPLVGFPLAFAVVPAGAASLMVAVQRYRVGWLLDAQPSRHAAPLRAPLRATDPGPRA